MDNMSADSNTVTKQRVVVNEKLENPQKLSLTWLQSAAAAVFMVRLFSMVEKEPLVQEPLACLQRSQ